MLMWILSRLHREEEGVTAVEYGVIGALIIGVLVLVITSLGLTLQGVFQDIVNALP